MIFVADQCAPRARTQIDKIDPLYYRRSSRIDIKEDTKINATQQESDVHYSHATNEDAPASNFISEVFFLCAQYLHIGPMHAVKEHKGIGQQVSHMQRQLNEMEADSTWRNVRSCLLILLLPCARADKETVPADAGRGTDAARD